MSILTVSVLLSVDKCGYNYNFPYSKPTFLNVFVSKAFCNFKYEAYFNIYLSLSKVNLIL